MMRMFAAPFGAGMVPKTAVASEVVIAGEQPPRAGISLHPRHRLRDYGLMSVPLVTWVPGRGLPALKTLRLRISKTSACARLEFGF